MTETVARPRPDRPGVAARRAGYTASVVVNVTILILVNAWPGWQAVPFLTSDTDRVLGFVNASCTVAALANLAYLLRDPAWLPAAGDAVTTTVGLIAVVRLWQVFPLDVGAGPGLVARVLLALAVIGSVIGIGTALARLSRSLHDPAHKDGETP